MALSDCPKCRDTPCTCGYNYLRYTENALIEIQRAVTKAINFKRSNPNAKYSGPCEKNTPDEDYFMRGA